MIKKFDIIQRGINLGIRIIQMSNSLPKTPAGYSLANQIIRSGTSVGANIEEAQDAISKKEFIRVMNIALKECRETIYWLTLIDKTNLLPKYMIEDCFHFAKELRLIIASIIHKSRSNQ